MDSRIDYIARRIAIAALYGDAYVISTGAASAEQLAEWRKAMLANLELVNLVEHYKKVFTPTWTAELNATMSQLAIRAAEIAQSQNGNPVMLDMIQKAMRTIGELYYAGLQFEGRLDKSNAVLKLIKPEAEKKA